VNPGHAKTFTLSAVFFSISTSELPKSLLNHFWLEAEQFQLQMNLN